MTETLKTTSHSDPIADAPLQSVASDALLAEVARRGLMTGLHGAVGALCDHLATTGALDGASNTTSYLAYRLRREDAKLRSDLPFEVQACSYVDANSRPRG